MSAFNAENYLQRAIQSILNQTHRNFTFFIVDNCSVDNTYKIIKGFSNIDNRIIALRSKTQLSYVEGRNIAIQKVQTEWFAIMDADDIAHPTRLENQVKVIREVGPSLGVVGTWAYSINEDEKVLSKKRMGPINRKEFDKLYSYNESIVPLDPSTIIRKKSFDKAGGYRPETVPAADIDLWYRICETGKEIRIIPKFLMSYRIHSKSTSVVDAMNQRLKSHFINYNMRMRRTGQEEVSFKFFKKNIWGSIIYRIPRLRNDYGLTFFKRAGHAYAYERYIYLVFYLILSMLFKPVHVLSQLYRQKIKK